MKTTRKAWWGVVIFRVFFFAICGIIVELKVELNIFRYLGPVLVRQRGLQDHSLYSPLNAYQAIEITKVVTHCLYGFACLSRGAERRMNASLFTSYLWKICGAKRLIARLHFLQSSNQNFDSSTGLGTSLAQLYSKITVQKKRGSYGHY